LLFEGYSAAERVELSEESAGAGESRAFDE
jgi:hypothetical protein